MFYSFIMLKEFLWTRGQFSGMEFSQSFFAICYKKILHKVNHTVQIKKKNIFFLLFRSETPLWPLLDSYSVGQYNRGIRSIEGKKTSLQCPLGRKLFNVKIATEMEWSMTKMSCSIWILSVPSIISNKIIFAQGYCTSLYNVQIDKLKEGFNNWSKY